jgi:D-alanyl-D-alanine carboxypeptidase/D-alanyl-D-alanine-endopeptidase (penicillin-binding protein 4)
MFGDNVFAIPSTDLIQKKTIPNFINQYKVDGNTKGDSIYFYPSLSNDKNVIITGGINPTKNKQIKGAYTNTMKINAERLSTFIFPSIKEVEVIYSDDVLVDDLPFRYLYSSVVLKEIIRTTLLHSLNLYAECIIKTNYTTDYQDYNNYWIKNVPSLKTAKLMDACGLARCNAISANQFTDALIYLHQNHPDFENLLPGNLYLPNCQLIKGLTYKSGHMDGIESYAGYLTTKSGKRIAFAFIINNYYADKQRLRNDISKLLMGVYNQ